MIQCQISDCKNGALEHTSVKFGMVMALCIRHHIMMHRLEQNRDNGIPINTLRKALGKKKWNEIMKRWTLKMGDDGYVHAIPREQKEKVIFT